MKKKLLIVLGSVMIASALCINSFADANASTLVLQTDNPIMTVDGKETEIDPGLGTTPVIENGRTLVPIRSIIEAMGGSVEWNSDTQTASLSYDNNSIELVIGSTTAVLNGENKTLDTAPAIINGRTMLPIRFIAEGFGFDTEWDADTRSITIKKTEEITVDNSQPEAVETPSEDSKILIAYFSRAENIETDDAVDATSSASLNPQNVGIEGNTKIVADMIHNEIGGDVFSIQTEELYPADYEENVDLADEELDADARPALKTHIDNFDEYDTIFIGYPIWWGTAPMPVYTFLEEYDFSGKTVIPFSTHKGSGLGSSVRDIKEALAEANVLDGFTIEGDNAVNAADEVKEALDELNLDINTVKFETEELISNNNGKNIYGVVYKPENVQEKMPTVIYSHGFGGSNENGRIYGEALAKKGYVVYSFDFCGGGNSSKSDLTPKEMSIFTEKTDLEAVIETIKDQPYVDTDNLFLLGASQGGMVSALVAADKVDEIKGLMLCFPAFCIPDNANEWFNGIDDVPETYNLMGMDIGPVYFEDIFDFDPYSVISEYNKDVLILHGDADEVVPIAYSEKAVETYPSAELKVLEGAGHGFRGDDAQTAIDYVINYLENHTN